MPASKARTPTQQHALKRQKLESKRVSSLKFFKEDDVIKCLNPEPAIEPTDRMENLFRMEKMRKFDLESFRLEKEVLKY